MRNALSWLKARLGEGATWASLSAAIVAVLPVREQAGRYMPLLLVCVCLGVLLKDKPK